ncbi:MAG TPA: tetratricopeptide repeat protein [Pyrinomonadaceae bacterium]|nr:tetratricopeptide repeat protein [Pyrinomonadaceae bacterium]
MAQSRIEIFAAMAADQPQNEMIWYGLASEYFKEGKWQEAADSLRKVLSIKPDYTAAYQMLGTALLNLGQRDDARSAWTQGIEIAERTGAWKAKQHMEGLLAGEESKTEFCAE